MGKYVPFSVFNTEAFSPRDRVEIYRESIGVFFQTEQFSQEREKFQAKIHSHLLSELLLIEVQTVAQNFIRPASLIAADGLDHFLIQLFFDGKTVHNGNPSELYCQGNRLIVIDGSRPWDAFNSDFRNLTLVVPRRLISSKLNSENDQHGKVLDPARNPFAEILRTHMLSLHSTAGQLNADYAHSIVQPTVDLAAAAMNYTGELFNSSVAEQSQCFALKLGIKSFIENNLGDPHLSVERIQVEFNLTRSTLYRLFPNFDGGIMNYVRKRRLQMAYRRLATSRFANETISQIAFEYGFENVSSFTRAFKAFFQELPSEVAKHRSPPKTDPLSSPNRVWENWFRIL